MKSLIVDIETDHKDVDRVSVIWCIGTLDRSTGKGTLFGPNRIHEAMEVLCAADRIYGHNIRHYDLPVLERLFGIQPGGQVIDTLLLSRLFYNGLSDEADEYGKHSLQAWGQRLGDEKQQHEDFSQFTSSMGEYCEQDCRVVLRMLEHFAEFKWGSDAACLELAYDAFLAYNHTNGFRLDSERAYCLRDKIQRRLDRFRRYLDRIFPPVQIASAKPSFYTLHLANGGPELGQAPKFATKTALHNWRKEHAIKPKQVEILEGPPSIKVCPFNPNSPTQIIPAMRKLGWLPVRENKSGSINCGEISLYQSGIPAGRLIAAYRGFDKLRQFVNQWINHQRDGRLYPSIVTIGTATGRSSATAPNIQQIPRAKLRASGMRILMKYGPLCRELFQPSEGYRLVGCDLAGIEVRLLAHLLHPYDGGEFAELVLDGDVHQTNADRIGISRDRAKTVLYGSMYGQGAPSLAEQLGIELSDAKEIIAAFTTEIPGFRQLKTGLIRQFNRGGRIRLIDGRRLQVTSSYKALNYAIQGDAAIVMKHWTMETAKRLEDTSYRTLAVVHDEIQSECLPEDVDHVVQAIEQTATDVGDRLGFRIRIDAEAKAGRSWRETH